MNSAVNSGNDGFKIALAKARQWCASEERCIFDIKQKLKKLECSSSEINMIIENLIEEGFIDEQRYAMAYSSGKFRISKWGKIKIASGLRMKNVPEKIIADALKSIKSEAYRDCLSRLLKKKQFEIRNQPPGKLKSKLARFALQKGFESEMVYEFLKSM